MKVACVVGARPNFMKIGPVIEAMRGRAELEPFLVRHRIRYTGGLDAETARAAREELHAHAVLITSLDLYRPTSPPAIAITMRLVSAGDEPIILWIDGASRAGDAPFRLTQGPEDVLTLGFLQSGDRRGG